MRDLGTKLGIFISIHYFHTPSDDQKADHARSSYIFPRHLLQEYNMLIKRANTCYKYYYTLHFTIVQKTANKCQGNEGTPKNNKITIIKEFCLALAIVN